MWIFETSMATAEIRLLKLNAIKMVSIIPLHRQIPYIICGWPT